MQSEILYYVSVYVTMPVISKRDIVVLFLSTIVQIRSEEPDFHSIFHTPHKKYDEFEIIERSSFDSNNRPAEEIAKCLTETPKAIANAQVLVNFAKQERERAKDICENAKYPYVLLLPENDRKPTCANFHPHYDHHHLYDRYARPPDYHYGYYPKLECPSSYVHPNERILDSNQWYKSDIPEIRRPLLPWLPADYKVVPVAIIKNECPKQPEENVCEASPKPEIDIRVNNEIDNFKRTNRENLRDIEDEILKVVTELVGYLKNQDNCAKHSEKEKIADVLSEVLTYLKADTQVALPADLLKNILFTNKNKNVDTIIGGNLLKCLEKLAASFPEEVDNIHAILLMTCLKQLQFYLANSEEHLDLTNEDILQKYYSLVILKYFENMKTKCVDIEGREYVNALCKYMETNQNEQRQFLTKLNNGNLGVVTTKDVVEACAKLASPIIHHEKDFDAVNLLKASELIKHEETKLLLVEALIGDLSKYLAVKNSTIGESNKLDPSEETGENIHESIPIEHLTDVENDSSILPNEGSLEATYFPIHSPHDQGENEERDDEVPEIKKLNYGVTNPNETDVDLENPEDLFAANNDNEIGLNKIELDPQYANALTNDDLKNFLDGPISEDLTGLPNSNEAEKEAAAKAIIDTIVQELQNILEPPEIDKEDESKLFESGTVEPDLRLTSVSNERIEETVDPANEYVEDIGRKEKEIEETAIPVNQELNKRGYVWRNPPPTSDPNENLKTIANLIIGESYNESTRKNFTHEIVEPVDESLDEALPNEDKTSIESIDDVGAETDVGVNINQELNKRGYVWRNSPSTSDPNENLKTIANLIIGESYNESTRKNFTHEIVEPVDESLDEALPNEDKTSIESIDDVGAETDVGVNINIDDDADIDQGVKPPIISALNMDLLNYYVHKLRENKITNEDFINYLQTASTDDSLTQSPSIAGIIKEEVEDARVTNTFLTDSQIDETLNIDVLQNINLNTLKNDIEKIVKNVDEEERLIISVLKYLLQLYIDDMHGHGLHSRNGCAIATKNKSEFSMDEAINLIRLVTQKSEDINEDNLSLNYDEFLSENLIYFLNYAMALSKNKKCGSTDSKELLQLLNYAVDVTKYGKDASMETTTQTIEESEIKSCNDANKLEDLWKIMNDLEYIKLKLDRLSSFQSCQCNKTKVYSSQQAEPGVYQILTPKSCQCYQCGQSMYKRIFPHDMDGFNVVREELASPAVVENVRTEHGSIDAKTHTSLPPLDFVLGGDTTTYNGKSNPDPGIKGSQSLIPVQRIEGDVSQHPNSNLPLEVNKHLFYLPVSIGSHRRQDSNNNILKDGIIKDDSKLKTCSCGKILKNGRCPLCPPYERELNDF